MWRVYEFLDGRFHSTVRAWLEENRVPKEQVAAFRAKIDALKRGGPDLVPGLIDGPIKKPNRGIKGIYKMKVHGRKGWVQLRPFMCYGPFENETETITILCGAIEKDWELDPADAQERADQNRRILLDAGQTRRRIVRIRIPE